MYFQYHYKKQKILEGNLFDSNYLFGSNKEELWMIYQSIKRFSQNKLLGDNEEYILGEEGLKLIVEDRIIKNKEISFYFIESRQSIIEELSLKKGTLCYQSFVNLKEKVEINRRLEQINDSLMLLEKEVQHFSKENTTHFIPYFKPCLYEDLLKYFTTIHTEVNNQSYPIDFLSTNHLVADYYQLLEKTHVDTAHPVILIVYEPLSFLSQLSTKQLVENLRLIAEKNPFVYLWVVSSQTLKMDYRAQDVEKTFVVYEDYQQLPEYTYVKQSLEKHYPDTFKYQDMECLTMLNRIYPYLGEKTIDDTCLSDSEIILLNIFNSLLGYDFKLSVSKKALTNLEKLYLIELSAEIIE